MSPASKPRWQQAAALVSLGAGGAVTGFSVRPRSDRRGPGRAAHHPDPAAGAEAGGAGPAVRQPDTRLRSAIVNVATYYLRMAATKTPAEMEALIWQRDSVDGADHGQSCAAFASLTLELAAQVVGQQSWVTGGGSYPWPLHDWADVRVDPNPASLQIISVLQDAQAHVRWHPLGRRLPAAARRLGDVRRSRRGRHQSYAGGVLDTVGGDSLPNLTVNAHQFSGPLAAQGVTGFVDNGDLASAPGPAGGHDAGVSGRHRGTRASPGRPAPAAASPAGQSGGERGGGRPGGYSGSAGRAGPAERERGAFAARCAPAEQDVPAEGQREPGPDSADR